MKLAYIASVKQMQAELEKTGAQPGSPEAQKIVAAHIGAWYQGGWVQMMTIAAAKTGDDLRADGVPTAFDGTNRRALAAMQEHRLRLVQGFTEEQTQVTLMASQRGLISGINPRATARVFRESIGLAPKQEAAVANYRRLLETNDRAALQRQLRDARFDSTVQTAQVTHVALAPEQIDRMVQRYRERMLKYRAEVIARTESLRALNAGQDAMYQQAIDEGKLSRDEIELEWMTAKDERVRPSHMLMNGQRRKIGEPFISGLGNLLYYPADPAAPAEDTVQCRCTRVPRHRLFEQFHRPPVQGPKEAL